MQLIVIGDRQRQPGGGDLIQPYVTGAAIFDHRRPGDDAGAGIDAISQRDEQRSVKIAQRHMHRVAIDPVAAIVENEVAIAVRIGDLQRRFGIEAAALSGIFLWYDVGGDVEPAQPRQFGRGQRCAVGQAPTPIDRLQYALRIDLERIGHVAAVEPEYPCCAVVAGLRECRYGRCTHHKQRRQFADRSHQFILYLAPRPHRRMDELNIIFIVVSIRISIGTRREGAGDALSLWGTASDWLSLAMCVAKLPRPHLRDRRAVFLRRHQGCVRNRRLHRSAALFGCRVPSDDDLK